MDIYTTLFDQEFVINRHIRSECRKAEERGEIIAYKNLGLSVDDIAERMGLDTETIENILSDIK